MKVVLQRLKLRVNPEPYAINEWVNDFFSLGEGQKEDFGERKKQDGTRDKYSCKDKTVGEEIIHLCQPYQTYTLHIATMPMQNR